MNAPVDEFLLEQARVMGVRLRDGRKLRARLTIAADGRESIVRKTGMVPVRTLRAPMDVFSRSASAAAFFAAAPTVAGSSR